MFFQDCPTGVLTKTKVINLFKIIYLKVSFFLITLLCFCWALVDTLWFVDDTDVWEYGNESMWCFGRKSITYLWQVWQIFDIMFLNNDLIPEVGMGS